MAHASAHRNYVLLDNISPKRARIFFFHCLLFTQILPMLHVLNLLDLITAGYQTPITTIVSAHFSVTCIWYAVNIVYIASIIWFVMFGTTYIFYLHLLFRIDFFFFKCFSSDITPLNAWSSLKQIDFIFCQNSNNAPDLWEHQEHLGKSNIVVIGWR